MPLISICITVYNLENYIGECLDSIVNQNFNDYEIILVDNGSSDKSVEICESYAAKYKDIIKFYKLPHPTVLGRSAIVAKENASGQYIHMVDGDDYLSPDYLSDITDIIHRENPDLIMGSFECILEENAIAINDAKFEVEKINGVAYKDAIKYLFSLPNFHKTHWRFLAKKDDDAESIKYMEDLKGRYGDMVGVALWLLTSKSIYYYDKPFYYYRCRAVQNMSTNLYDSTTGDFFKALLSFQETLVRYDYFSKIDKDTAFIMVDLLMDLFLSGRTYISDDEIKEISSLIDKYKRVLDSFKIYNQAKTMKMLDLIEQYGSYHGFRKFLYSFDEEKIKGVKDIKDKEIYIFPMGIYSSGNARLLKEHDFNVVGYLDNDVSKQGKSFSDVRCFSPNILAEVEGNRKSDIVIMISTIYKELVPTLEKQILKMGFKNIIVF